MPTPSGGIFDYDAKKEQLEEILRELEDPAVWNEPEKAQKLGQQRASLQDIVVSLKRWTQVWVMPATCWIWRVRKTMKTR